MLTMFDFENLYLLRHYGIHQPEDFNQKLAVRQAERQEETAQREQELAFQLSVIGENE